MSNYAHITVTRHELPLNRFYETYSWEGKKHWEVVLPFYFYTRHDINKFPWPLEVVDYHSDWLDIVCMRKDTAIPYWLFTKIKYKTKKLVYPVYHRIILTAMVWGLAYVPDYEIPSWRHLGKKK